MATATYIALANTTLSSAVSSVTFSSIPATYRDLVLVIAGTATSTDQMVIRFNSSTTGYSEVTMLGAASTSSYTSSVNRLSQIALSTTQSNGIMHIMDYSATDKHKTALYRNNLGGSTTYATAGRWADTSAITSILLALETGGNTFASGCSFALYGIIS